MTLGEKVKCMRANKSMSQENLARELKINRNHLSRIETGISEPSATILKRLALAFDISIDSLLEIDKNNVTNEDKVKMICEKCKTLNVEDLDFLLRMIYIMKSEFVKSNKSGK